MLSMKHISPSHSFSLLSTFSRDVAYLTTLTNHVERENEPISKMDRKSSNQSELVQ